MATTRTYTLDDFASYGRQHFPDAYALVADPWLYVIESRRGLPYTKPGRSTSSLVLAKKVNRTKPYLTLQEVVLYGSRVSYIYDPRDGIFHMKEVIDAYDLNAGDLRAPFCYVAADPEDSAKASAKLYGEAYRLNLLVHFVFLLTGRITHFRGAIDHDLLNEFKTLCEHIQQRKAAESNSVRKAIFKKGEPEIEADLEDYDLDNTGAGEQHPQQARSAESTPSTIDEPHSVSPDPPPRKRTASQMADDPADENEDRPRKCIKLLEEASSKLAEALSMSRENESWGSARENALRDEIAGLRGQLANREAEIAEQAARIAELEAKNKECRDKLAQGSEKLGAADERTKKQAQKFEDLMEERDERMRKMVLKMKELRRERDGWRDRYVDEKDEWRIRYEDEMNVWNGKYKLLKKGTMRALTKGF
ncbi:hypothetical protein C7974DRAFT_444314 [Boeremia exigua]|uniref:uncharacterized protein n=1 Tax=Boeremia exigua TaxID=749465 RepID=UPI001E8E2718|nr:uncharacterized protein C7974DRAFT_444314 [Boeremia exigua]KAH6614280.1 hypothetical protein C7974DRAFT_444314 [Boeremia exigua]